MTAHSVIGASSSDRWMNCPGSVRLSRGIEDAGSIYAREGTAAHILARECVLSGLDPAHMIGDIVDIGRDMLVPAGERSALEPDGVTTFEIDDEMAGAVQVYLDTVRPLAGPEHEFRVEHRFDLSELYPGMFGTADFSDYNVRTKDVTVVDFKYGRGVAVEAAGNPQLLYYALGVAKAHHNRGIRTVRIGVVQPRCPHRSGPVRWFETGAVELLEWSFDLIAAARRTEDPAAPLSAGEWCKFCPAAGICPALRERALKSAMADFTEHGALIVSDPKTYDADVLARTLREVDLIEDWCRRVREFAHHEAEAGRVPPGWKLVAKRASRKWKDEPAVIEFLELYGLDDADIYGEPKLRSPAQIEKAIGGKNKDAIAPYWHSVSAGSVLAPLDDPREPVRPEAEQDFAPYVEGEDTRKMTADELLAIPPFARREPGAKPMG